jgi:uncharacterized membrane protein
MRLGRGLGWFSVVLGTAQLVVPEAMLRLVGLDAHPRRVALMRAVGARELAVGGPLLVDRRKRRWVLARVAGDLMDVALLLRALFARDARRGRVLAALGAVLGATALDVVGSLRADTAVAGEERVRRAITVERSPDEAYGAWRRLDRLPAFMAHLESVQESDHGRSHWVATGPGGARVEWDAEIVEDRPAEVLAWRSIPGSGVRSEGRVRFDVGPHGRGAEVHVEMVYEPPAGAVGAAVASLFGQEPTQQVSDDLRRFKQMLEIGEIVRSEATDARRRLKQHPAQPPAGATTLGAADGAESTAVGARA